MPLHFSSLHWLNPAAQKHTHLSSPLLILMTLSILVPDHEIQKPLLAVNVIYFEEITGWHPLIRIYLPSSNTPTFLDSCLELSLDQLTFPFPLCWISEANTAGLNIDVLFFCCDLCVRSCVYISLNRKKTSVLYLKWHFKCIQFILFIHSSEYILNSPSVFKSTMTCLISWMVA